MTDRPQPKAIDAGDERREGVSGTLSDRLRPLRTRVQILYVLAALIAGSAIALLAAYQFGVLNVSAAHFVKSTYQNEYLASSVGQTSGTIVALGSGWSLYTNPRSHYSLEIPDAVYPKGGSDIAIPLVAYEDSFDDGESNASTRFDAAYDLVPASRVADVRLPKGVAFVKVLRGAGQENASPVALTLHVRAVSATSDLLEVLESTFPACPFTGASMEASENPGTYDVTLTAPWHTLGDLAALRDNGCAYSFLGDTYVKYSSDWHLVVYTNDARGGQLATSANRLDTAERRMFTTFKFE